MPYPIMPEIAATTWFEQWKTKCEEAEIRVPAPEIPAAEERPAGEDVDWTDVCSSMITKLEAIWEPNKDKEFESKAAIIVHECLPDHAALRDPEFWSWLSMSVGAELVNTRYPYKPKDRPNSQPEEDKPEEQNRPSYLPAKANYFGNSAKENFFFRLWIRTEMARIEGADDDTAYKYVAPGAIDFWRSHIFRQLYAHHRPFAQAFVDFQFPAGGFNGALNTYQIRELAKELLKACANVQVELLDMDQSGVLIKRVWQKAKPTIEAQEKLKKATE